jgi:hypothetical protein
LFAESAAIAAAARSHDQQRSVQMVASARENHML